MNKIYKSVEEVIGHTPLMELCNYEKSNNVNAHILLKMENANPLGSLKDRVALAMILDLEEKGRLKPGDCLVEASSGNTGIALAALARKRGYKCRIYLEQVTEERIKLLEAYGAECIESDKDPKFQKAIEKVSPECSVADAVSEMLAEEEKRTGVHFEFTVQWDNESNYKMHYNTTAPEIWEAADGNVDAFVGGIGSGGSLRGLSDYFKERNADFKVIAFDQPDDDLAALTGVHRIVGTPEFMRPKNISTQPFDEAISVTRKQAIMTANMVAKYEGVLFGVSTGAGIYLATELAKRPEYAGKTIVVFAYDDAMKYLSTDLVDKDYILD